MLTLRLTDQTKLPIDARALLQDEPSTLDQVTRRPVRVGNRRCAARDAFDIQGDASSGVWRFEGQMSRVHHLGEGLRTGEVRVAGSVGRHCGARMSGGSITIEGSAGDWLGAEMLAGRITVNRHAGNLVGAAYRGSKTGMRGGQILVLGSVGDETAHSMRRGLIVVAGNSGELTGHRMRAGTLLVYGACGRYAGLDMLRGTIGLFGERAPALPPSFRSACCLTSPVLRVIGKQVERLGGSALAGRTPREADMFNGDLLRGGRGEVFTRR